MTHGKGIVLSASKLTQGIGIDVSNNQDLTSGKLLNIRTTSSHAHNPVLLSAQEMTSGDVMKIKGDSLTSGSALVLTSNNGSSMINEMVPSVVDEIMTGGKLALQRSISTNLFVHDTIVLENCQPAAFANEGVYIIDSIVTNATTKYTCSIPCNDSTTLVNITSMVNSTNATNTTNATNATNATAGTSVSYICGRVADCHSQHATVTYVEHIDCTPSNDTFCEYNTHEFVQLVRADDTSKTPTFTGSQGAGNTCTISRMGGNLLSLEGRNQEHGTMLSVRADRLTSGDGMHIINTESDTLREGSLLRVSTRSSAPANGVARVSANNAATGKIISIEANALTQGNAIDVTNDGNGLTTGSLLKLSTNA
eukprot:Stramenopile-MAST_4_protein_5921